MITKSVAQELTKTFLENKIIFNNEDLLHNIELLIVGACQQGLPYLQYTCSRSSIERIKNHFCREPYNYLLTVKEITEFPLLDIDRISFTLYWNEP